MTSRRLARAMTRSMACLLIGGAACAAPREAGRQSLLETPAARRLVGTWQLQLIRDGVHVEPGAVGEVRKAEGTVTFLTDRVGRVSATELPGATHSGVYDLDLSPLGFMPDTPGPVPAAVARVGPGGAASDGAGPSGRTTADSVFIVLSPGAGRLYVMFAGTMRGDSIGGRWRAESFSAGGAAGDFVMRRTRDRE